MRAAPEKPEKPRFLLDVARFQFGQENPGQLAHAGGVAEVVLHEMLDRAAALIVAVAEPFCHGHLIIEGQLILGAARDQVQMAAHRQ